MATRIYKTKLNRVQQVLTAEQLRSLPALYSQDGKGFEAVAQVKFFCGALTWFATEFDAEEGLFFGLVYNRRMADQCPAGEWGYFSIEDLRSIQLVERDLHFKPVRVCDALQSDAPGFDHAEALAFNDRYADAINTEAIADDDDEAEAVEAIAEAVAEFEAEAVETQTQTEQLATGEYWGSIDVMM